MKTDAGALRLDCGSSATVSGPLRRKVEGGFLLLLIAAAFLLRVWGLSQARFWDEAVYLQNAEVICCGKTNYSELDSRPPLLSLIFAGVFLVRNHVYAAGVTTALLNALGPALLYLCGRSIVGRIPAAIAALLLAFAPFFVGVFPPGFGSDDTGNSLLSDSPALTLMLVAVWFSLSALRKSMAVHFAIAGFFLGLTFLMRFASLSTIAVLSLLIFAAPRRWRAALAWAVGFSVAVVPYLCWSRVRYGAFLATVYNGWVYFQGAQDSPSYYLKNFGNIFTWLTLAGLALWAGRWVWGRSKDASGLRRGEPATRLELFLWFWAAALLVFFSSLPHKEPRYVMPVGLPLFLLAGSGLSVLVGGRQRWSRVAGTVLLLAAFSCTVLPDRQRFESPFVDNSLSEEMRVSDFLSHAVPAGTVLYSNFNYPVFAYYTNLPIHRLLQTGPALYNELNHLPEDGILIAYREQAGVADPRLSWLDSNPHFRRLQDFASLVLYRYRAESRRGSWTLRAQERGTAGCSGSPMRIEHDEQ